MKKQIKKLLTIDLFWRLINLSLGTISKIFIRLRNARISAKHEAADADFNHKVEKALECSSGFIVRNGPFKGMRYPCKQAFGSSFYPKILGSYEQEISEALTYVTSQSYSAVVDVGCAEGYYAVGIGMKTNARVFAFDTNKHALNFCREMGRINGVEINTGALCDKAALLEIDLGSRALIFCDCEGYEIELIDNKLAEQLRQHDFLIETHDFVEIEITKRILDTLIKTHDCQIFESIDDIIKAYTYHYPELESFGLADRRRILGEGRPKIMRWVFAKARIENVESGPLTADF